MANFKRFLGYRLDKYNLTIEALNSRKNSEKKLEVLDYLIKLGIAENISERKLLKEIRSTGLKFSNELGRTRYQKLYKVSGRKKQSKSGNYLASIRKDSKPLISRIPKIKTSGNKKGSLLYVAQFFLLCDNSKKRRKLKKDSRLVTDYQNNYFNKITEIGFWSKELLSRNEVEQRFIEMIMSDVPIDYESPISKSDWNDFDFNVCEVVAFKYVRILQAV